MTLVLSVRNTQSLDAGTPREISVEDKGITIGRSSKCDWTLPDSKNQISSRHCEIAFTPQGYVLKDISTNGTFLNGSAERLQGEHTLAEGDLLRIGNYEIAAHFGVKSDGVPLKPPKEEGKAAEKAPAPARAPSPPAPTPERTVFAPSSRAALPDASAEDEALSAEQRELWEKVADANDIDWERGGFGKDAREAVAKAMVAATADELAAAYLEAAGVAQDKVTAGAPETIAKGGSLLRRLVSGLVVMVEARARAKSQMGAETTQLQLNGNNPIKFARTPEAALAQLLNPTEKGFLDAEKAVEDAFLDLQSHQVATMAAIPGALRATLERFSPGSIKRRAENMGVLAKILATARDAALWTNYEREYTAVAQQSDEAFMEVFAREFRKAYAKQVAKAQK